MRLLVPEADDRLWPTLGPEICDFIEWGLVHGPGDVLGEPIELTDEIRYIIYRAYEVYPRRHELAGRRRFKRTGLSRRKGWSKTELAAWLAITEAHPEAPVRCDGWRKEDGEWIPVGRPIRDPYIPMVATTEEQTEDLAYGAVLAILREDTCNVADDFVAGEERTLVARGPGELKPLASAPSARDGARTTFQHFDETHLFISHRLKNAHRTMGRNIPKRKAADAWSFETTTAFAPGEASVAEDTHTEAEKITSGEAERVDLTLYYDHLQADETHDITTDEGLRAAIVQASGDAIAWADVPAIENQFREPKNAESDSRRYWLNQPRASADRWIAPLAWDGAHKKRNRPRKGSRITLGFWGGVNRDSAGFVAATPSGYCFVVEYWEPTHGQRIARDEVEAVLADTYDRWDVLELVTSRTGGSGWIQAIEDWDDIYGNVVEIPINSPARMGPACDRVYTAVHQKDLRHDGNPTLARHVANAMPVKSAHGTYIRPGPGESNHITLARALVLAYERAMGGEEAEDEEDLGAIVVG